jgi:fatty acid desaturase
MTTGNLRAANFISAKIEWPTWLLLVIVYSAWISLTFYWDSIPGWLLWLIGGYTIALHSSLQHEALHGITCAITRPI